MKIKDDRNCAGERQDFVLAKEQAENANESHVRLHAIAKFNYNTLLLQKLLFKNY